MEMLWLADLVCLLVPIPSPSPLFPAPSALSSHSDVVPTQEVGKDRGHETRSQRQKVDWLIWSGDSLAKYGRARCRMAGAQEEFGNRLGDGYMSNLGEFPSTFSTLFLLLLVLCLLSRVVWDDETGTDG